ncbi:MAG: L,D-transpeptidase family protein [Patescibacteria group bacterium]
MKRFLLLLTFVSLLLPLTSAQASGSGIEIKLFAGTNKEKRISIPSQNSVGGVSIAAADLGTDGVPELIVGNGIGLEPHVRVLRQNGTEVGSFLAYAKTMMAGVNVAVCDLDGDGFSEIVTSPQRGGGPHVRVFDRFGKSIELSEFVYDKTNHHGVNIVCGDLIGDDRAELVTLPTAGEGMNVRIWKKEENKLVLVQEFFPFETTAAGVVGTIHNHQLILSEQKTNSPQIKTFENENGNVKEKNKTTKIQNEVGVASIVIHSDQLMLSATQNFISADLDGDAIVDLISAPARPSFTTDNETQIRVDLSEQRLYAYTDGILENTFLISSGLRSSTPLGNHRILAKIPFVHYRWVYGANDPRNYDLGRVQYNLRFAPHIYLHYAYWHNNFGHPMSRGCVNVSFANMKWLYEWAREGIAVHVVN